METHNQEARIERVSKAGFGKTDVNGHSLRLESISSFFAKYPFI
jgi:hypothetical protein